MNFFVVDELLAVDEFLAIDERLVDELLVVDQLFYRSLAKNVHGILSPA